MQARSLAAQHVFRLHQERVRDASCREFFQEGSRTFNLILPLAFDAANPWERGRLVRCLVQPRPSVGLRPGAARRQRSQCKRQSEDSRSTGLCAFTPMRTTSTNGSTERTEHPGNPYAGERNRWPRVLLGATEHLLRVESTDVGDPATRPADSRLQKTAYISLASPPGEGCLAAVRFCVPRSPVYAIRSRCLKAASDCSNPLTLANNSNSRISATRIQSCWPCDSMRLSSVGPISARTCATLVGP